METITEAKGLSCANSWDDLLKKTDNGRLPQERMGQTSWNLGNIFKDQRKILVARYIHRYCSICRNL
jgi:hypothetical protein